MITPAFDFDIGHVVASKADGKRYVVREKLLAFNKTDNLIDYVIEYRCIDGAGSFVTFSQTDIVVGDNKIKGFCQGSGGS